MNIKSRTFDVPTTAINGTAQAGDKNYRVQLTPEERKRVQERILKAKTLKEIELLERELNEGRIPVGVGAAGDAMEL